MKVIGDYDHLIKKYRSDRMGKSEELPGRPKESIPPKPIPRPVSPPTLKKALEMVDRELRTRALAGRDMDSFVSGAVQLCDVSVKDQHYDKETYLRFCNLEFSGAIGYEYSIKWCLDNDLVHVGDSGHVELHFKAPSPAHYLVLIYAATFGVVHDLKYQLDGVSGTLNMKYRDNYLFGPPLPVLQYLEPGAHVLDLSVESGYKFLFRSMSVTKF